MSQATAEKIPELFPGGTIHGQTALVLVNALYLKAPWKYQLQPPGDQLRPFTRHDGVPVKVPTMHFDEYLPSAAASTGKPSSCRTGATSCRWWSSPRGTCGPSRRA